MISVRARLLALAVLLSMALAVAGPFVAWRASPVDFAIGTVAATAGLGDPTAQHTEAHLSAAIATPASLVASSWQRLEFHASLIFADVVRGPIDRAPLSPPQTASRSHAPPHLLTDCLRI